MSKEQENFQPASVDRAEGQNTRIEPKVHEELRDRDFATLDTSLHQNTLQGPERDNVTRSMTELREGDANKLPQLLSADGPLGQYRAKLESNVFDDKGNIKAGASQDDIRRLVDYNNAEISALTERKTIATKNHGYAGTMDRMAV